MFALASVTVPAVELTLFALSEPLLAPIWVWLVVSEMPSASSFIGGAILLFALLTYLFANPMANKKALKALADTVG
jgi:drug/metabolite transporter (DMT)-like permease